MSSLSPLSRVPRLLALLGLLLAACGEDKIDGVVEVGDADAILEILLPDGTVDFETDLPDVEDGDGDAGDIAPCPGCTGSPCDDNTDCDSGYCLEGPSGKECVRTCQSECPSGYACRGVQDGSGDPVFLCLYEHIAFCQPCNVDGDCETGIGGLTGARCLPEDPARPDDGRFCRTRCTAGSCPSGATCEAVGEESLCRPGTPNEPGQCTCSPRAVALALSTDCAVVNAIGTCGGERVCATVGPVPACDATPAVTEVCNDADDDCDGETDEDFPLHGEACDGDDTDKCATGIYICGANGELACTDDANSDVERCNGADDDCDGETDEDFPGAGEACDGADPDTCKDGVLACDGLALACNDGPETATDGEELCNGVDDNCNTQVDEGYEDKNQPCDGDDADGCKDGRYVCALDGRGLACDDDGASKVELCNELDDDCQNGPDDTFPDKLKPCDGPDADGCKDGVWVCNADGTGLACTDDGLAKIEVCNDVDDDCDGATDEDFPLKGEACDSEVDTDLCATGRWVCGGNTLVCDDDATSLVETCNGEDDDCDGLTDQLDGDLADELNPNQLGACAGSVMACAGAGGYVEDYTGVPGYGLPETPDGSYADENCDGLDGDIARGVFVAVGGANNGTCTKAAPCGSVSYAIGQTDGTRNQVYVQAGTYTEVVDIPSGKNVEIYGGFNSSWVRKARTEAGHKVTLKGLKHGGDGEYMAVRVRSATVKLADLVVQAPSPGSDERKNGQGLSSYAIHALQSSVTLERVEVLQGNGASGADGTPGSDAPSLSPPSKGQTGGAGVQELNLCDASTRGAGVPGQSNSQCSANTAGGASGRGGTMDSGCGCLFDICICWPDSCDPTSGDNGLTGQGSAAGGGGGGSSACNTPSPGNPGGTAVQGLGGNGGTRGGSIANNFWVGGNGGDGTLGSDGSGGGGGGGAGGCDDGQEVPLQNSSGAGGGGGGAGGCRAQAPGAGGRSGGASFGLFAIGGTVKVTESRFVLGNGGAGGRGGAGAQGQPGGEGGEGGPSEGDARPGGKGGKGGDGAASGGGGGGAGGNAIGLFTFGSTVEAGGTNEFTGGAAGPRGEGGDAPAPAGVSGDGKPGQAGRVGDVEACQLVNGCGD